MSIWSITDSSTVIKSGRIDGEYYLPVYLENEALFSKLETKPLPQLFSVSDGNHLSVSRHFLDKGGVPYYRGQDINDFFIENASPARIPEEVYSSAMMGRSHFCAGDVLLSIVGTIGSLSIVPPTLGNATGSCKIAILRPKGSYSGSFLAAFLISKYGQLQIHRNTRGAVQMGLILKDLTRIRVPNISVDDQEEVAGTIDRAIEANTLGRTCFLEGQRTLEAALGLNKLATLRRGGYYTCFSQIETSRRFDSEHFFPAFAAFRSALPSGISLSSLSNALDFCKRGKQPTYSTTGLPVVNSKHVQPNRVLLDKNRLARPSLDVNLQIRFGDILLNGTGRGTIGRAAPYLSEEMAIPDNHVTILRTKGLDPAYLSLYLNSAAGQMQVEMHQRGSSGQLELYPLDIRKFLVWLAPNDFQQEIRRLHDLAAAAERESRLLLQQAKSRVEQLIEEAVQS